MPRGGRGIRIDVTANLEASWPSKAEPAAKLTMKGPARRKRAVKGAKHVYVRRAERSAPCNHCKNSP